MIVIRFPDSAAEVRGLGFLAGRFSFTARKAGEVLVPEAALSALAAQGFQFTVEGAASYEQSVPAVRDSAPAAVQ